MEHKIVLVSFADKRYRNALKRLEGYTRDFPFTERHFHTQDNIFSKSYWKKLKPWLYRRGYGYWEWKSKLVKYYLDSLADGDYLVWSDAGVFWNSTSAATNRFREYISMLTDNIDILAFQEPYIEQEWTKGDVLKFFNAYDCKKLCTTHQLWGGAFILKKSPTTELLVERWANINEISKELVTDKRSEYPNKDGFKEHRHDQSSFSLLVKQVPHIEILPYETHPDNNNWKTLANYPIWGKRHKLESPPFTEIIKNKLLCPWRMVLNIYFRYIRKYDFMGNGYPW